MLQFIKDLIIMIIVPDYTKRVHTHISLFHYNGNDFHQLNNIAAGIYM